MSADCRDLIARIFQADPDKRATVEDIRRHPWFLRNLPPELAVHALHINLGNLQSVMGACNYGGHQPPPFLGSLPISSRRVLAGKPW